MKCDPSSFIFVSFLQNLQRYDLMKGHNNQKLQNLFLLVDVDVCNMVITENLTSKLNISDGTPVSKKLQARWLSG